MHLTFRSLSEDKPGNAWRQVVAHGWPGWKEWYVERQRGKASFDDARRAVRRHMPEFELLWEELSEACQADGALTQFLGFWCPPRYLVNCSQAVVVDDDGPFLIRNYDLDPALNEATFLTTNWRGTRVCGMVEAMAGLADGMNEHGLAASLTFGGRVVTGKGFGIPLIMRYLLQSCRDTQDAIEAMRAVPTHMSYNVTVIDKAGDWATVFLAPDRPPMVRQQAWATNHQLGVEWPRHGRVSNTLGRAEHLEDLLRTSPQGHDLSQAFNKAPIFSTNYAEGFGTVYTAAYRPTLGTVQLSWKDGTRKSFDLHQPSHQAQPIAYGADGSFAPTAPTQDPRPAWYQQFLTSYPADLPDPDGSLHSRMAAFWRRNHLGQDQGWSNLTGQTDTQE